MGYGLMALGYALTFFVSLSLYGWVVRLIGYLVMAYGLFKLRDYFPSYALSLFTVLALFLVGLGEAGCELAALFGAEGIDGIMTAVYYIRDGLVLVFHIFYLISTYIAFGVVGLEDRRISAVTDIVAVVLGYVLYTLAAFGVIGADVSLVAQIIWMIMVFVLIFGCYMRICPEGDENMPRRESKIGFINKFSEALEKRENEAIERTRREIEEKKRAAASGNTKKRRKKKK